MSLTMFETAQPSLIPGYGGYLPQYIYRVGETYGRTSHKIMLDPNINFADRLVLSDRSIDDITVNRPNDTDIDFLKSRTKYGDVVFMHPIISGYAGCIPGIQGRLGQSFSADTAVALSEFERRQHKLRQDRQQLKHYKTLQCDQGEPRELLDRLVQQNKWKMPLYLVRPEARGIARFSSVPEPAPTNFDKAVSPYFSDPNDPKKNFMLGYAGHIPFGTARFGGGSQAMSNASLVDFTNNYRRRLSTEWAPVTVSTPDPPSQLTPPALYHKNVGMIPNYMGHLPGAQFRFGKTFGNDTKDAKRWLRGDYST